jgi:hypothetical protein
LWEYPQKHVIKTTKKKYKRTGRKEGHAQTHGKVGTGKGKDKF